VTPACLWQNKHSHPLLREPASDHLRLKEGDDHGGSAIDEMGQSTLNAGCHHLLLVSRNLQLGGRSHREAVPAWCCLKKQSFIHRALLRSYVCDFSAFSRLKPTVPQKVTRWIAINSSTKGIYKCPISHPPLLRALRPRKLIRSLGLPKIEPSNLMCNIATYILTPKG